MPHPRRPFLRNNELVKILNPQSPWLHPPKNHSPQTSYNFPPATEWIFYNYPIGDRNLPKRNAPSNPSCFRRAPFQIFSRLPDSFFPSRPSLLLDNPDF